MISEDELREVLEKLVLGTSTHPQWCNMDKTIPKAISEILAWHNKETEKLQRKVVELGILLRGKLEEHRDVVNKLQARIKELEANIERLEIELYGRKLQTKP